MDISALNTEVVFWQVSWDYQILILLLKPVISVGIPTSGGNVFKVQVKSDEWSLVQGGFQL